MHVDARKILVLSTATFALTFRFGGWVSRPILASKMLIAKLFAIPVTEVFINLVKKMAHREFGRACARPSIMVMLAGRETTFWQNCADVQALFCIILMRCQENCQSSGAFFVGNVGAKCTYITSNLRQNWSSDQPFLITFSKNEDDIYVQKVAFLDNFKRVFEKFLSVAKLKPFF